MQILSRFKSVTTFILDMDGVLTDGSILVDESGNWLRRMSLRDGYALQLAVKAGFNVIVISGSSSPQVANRLNKLGVQNVFMAVTDKENTLKELAISRQIPLTEILYMGDDIPDYSCMKIVGLPACPADAAIEIKEAAAYISPFKGGHGCVRDVIEKVMKLHNKWTLKTTTPST